ncbi:hypothetical protein GW17_00021851, partial [Ensete ventricosum]
ARAELAAATGSTSRGGGSQTQVAAQVPRPLRPPEAAAGAADAEPRDWLHRGNPANLLADPNQEELQSLEGVQPVSRCCKEVNEFVGIKPDPLMPMYDPSISAVAY